MRDYNKFSSSYEYLKGTKNYLMRLKEDKAVKVKITTISGRLHIDVRNSKDESVYSGNFDNDFSFTLNLEKDKYKVYIITSFHEGSYSFSWE